MSARSVPGALSRDAAQSAAGGVPTVLRRNGGRLQGASRLIVPLAACLVLLAATAVLAQSGGDYTLSWSTVDGGGGTFSTGGDYSLGGTAGQPDAGGMAGGTYALGGGFWGGGAVGEPWSCLYLPLVLLSY